MGDQFAFIKAAVLGQAMAGAMGPDGTLACRVLTSLAMGALPILVVPTSWRDTFLGELLGLMKVSP